jgi:hypothetical protein
MAEQKKLYQVVAVCSKCGKVLQESHMLTKRQLIVNWQDTVIQAASFICKDCKTRIPNFEIDLKIYRKGIHQDINKLIPRLREKYM